MSKIKRREFLSVAGSAMALTAAGRSQAMLGDDSERRPIKVGQIGTAHDHASGKMHTLRKLLDDYEVVGVVEPDPLRRREAEKSPIYRGVPWMTEDELLAIPGLKVVAVETRVEDLVATAARCVAAGVHVHLDKPAGESLGPFRKLLAEASTRGLTVQMGYMYRNNPAFQFCFDVVRNGWLGEIFEVHGVMAKQITASERERNLPYRGGMMFQLGCHLIDAMVRVLGNADSVTPYIRRLQQETDDLADNQLAVFEYPKATATIRVSVTEVEGWKRRQFVVCGTSGTVEIRPLEPPSVTLVLDRPRAKYVKGLQEITLPKMPGRYDDQLRQLARIARGQSQPEYSTAHDLAVQELVLKASGLPTEDKP